MEQSRITRRGFVGATASTLACTAFSAASARSATLRPDRSVPDDGEAPPPVTRILAEWAITVKPEQVPPAAKREAMRSILNWTGAAIGGSTESAVNTAVAALEPYAGGGKVNLFGRRERFDPLRAALLTGISSHVLDFDDGDIKTLIHPAASVASALFPLAQDSRITGADFIHAFVIGTEIEGQIGEILYPSHYDLGWHITGTCGAFGAAAACGRILGLNLDQMMWALGLAATQASGLKIMFGTMAKSFHPGHAAEGGLLSALLAAKGFTASEQAIEGKGGYILAASTSHDFSRLHELGTTYAITRNGYKPFPSGIVLHSIIDGMIQLHDEKHPAAAEVKSITIKANPLVLQLTGKKTPKTGLEAKFSVYHAAAVSLVRGRGGVKEFSDDAVKDPAVLRLRSLVQVESSDTVRTDEVYLQVTMENGTVFTKHIEHALGTLDNPMSDKQLAEKFRSLTEGILPVSQTDGLLSQLLQLPDLPDAGVILKNGSLQ
jgi:2-methylcitrate dehydratase PrpD